LLEPCRVRIHRIANRLTGNEISDAAIRSALGSQSSL
jgi:hypothetical protein